MRRRTSIDWLIEPSFGSFTLCLICSLAVMAIALVSTASHNGLFYNLLFGTTSSATQIETASNTVKAFTDTILGNTVLNKLMFFGFWLLVGLVVYTLVMSFSYYTGGILMFWQELHQVNSRKKLLAENFWLRFLLQSIGILLLVFFSIFFIKILLPFSILCGRITVGVWGNIAALGYFLAGFATLFLSFHLYIILIRFAALRVRLSGNILS